MSAVVPGIPSRTHYGDPNFSGISPGQLIDWIVQRHDARRAGTHYDVRLGTPETGLYSWAVRKGLPLAGKKHLAVQQPLHTHAYKEFEGAIPEGYGAGTVSKHDAGKVLITKIAPNKIHFTTASGKYPERFVLVRPSSLGDNPKNWLLMNTSVTDPLDITKIPYKTVPADDVESLLSDIKDGTSVQAKIDGALSLAKFLKDKVELFSHRTSKVTGRPIVHTERILGGIPIETIPKEYVGSVVKGELYAKDGDKAIPPQELSGLLNSSIENALHKQKLRNFTYRNQVFDIARLGRTDIDPNTVPYEARRAKIQKLLDSLRSAELKQLFELPEEAKTPEEAKKLYNTVASGQHPLTTEGIVVHPPTGKPLKSKLTDEYDVFIRDIIPGKLKWQDRGAGAFSYSLTPNGKAVGEVGTGFSDQTRQDMFQHPANYIGRRTRVHAIKQSPTGTLFQPSFISLHEG